MYQSHYEAAFDVLNGIAPWGKEVYSIPMQLLTPKFVGKLPSDAVYLARVDEVLECQMAGEFERYLLKFGDCTFEGFGASGVMPVVNKPDVVCFTPRVVYVNMQGKEFVVLDVIGMNCISSATKYIGYPGDGQEDTTDYDTLGKDQQQLDREIAAFEAMT